jgi:hypothetical protein
MISDFNATDILSRLRGGLQHPPQIQVLQYDFDNPVSVLPFHNFIVLTLPGRAPNSASRPDRSAVTPL